MKIRTKYDRYKRGNKAPVHVEVYFSRTVKMYIHTSVNVEKKHWSESEKCVKKSCPDAAIHNNKINQVVRQVHDYYIHCTLQNIDPNPDGLKSYMPGMGNDIDILQYARSAVAQDEKNISESTLKQRMSFLKNLENFNPGTFKNMKKTFVEEYHAHLLKTMKPESTSKNHKPMKRILMKAYRNDIIDFDPYENFRIPDARNRTVFLTTVELEKIRNYKGIERLNRVRDIFLFQCLTGIAYTDMQNLSPDNLHVNNDVAYIVSERKKTGQQFIIPLLSEAYNLIKQYGNAETLMPTISNQRMNGYLKEIADICGINKQLTTHVARHTFATLMLARGMPLESISHILGHSSTRVTQIYSKIVLEKLQEDFKRLNINKL